MSSMRAKTTEPRDDVAIPYEIYAFVTETLPRIVEDQVSDAVDAELRNMIGGEPFRRLAGAAVNGIVKEALWGVNILSQDHAQGSDTGSKEKCKKVSISIPDHLYERLNPSAVPSRPM